MTARRTRCALVALVLLAVLLTGFMGRAPEAMTAQSPLYIPFVAKAQNKLGMAGCPASCAVFGCSWCYAWSSWPGGPADVERVPMLWDETHVTDGIGGNSDWLMGFNEPDLCPRQACLTPEQAVEPYYQGFVARNSNRKIVAPVPSDQHIDWLPQFRQAFFARYGFYPRWDALAVHCYHTVARCQQDIARFEAWAVEWGVPELWVTEFWFPTEAESRAIVAILEADPMITRIAPYASRVPDCADFPANPSLLHADLLTPTETGWRYARPIN